MKRGWATAFMVSSAVSLLGLSSGCATESFCFSDCGGDTTTGGTGGTAAMGGVSGSNTGGIGNIGGSGGSIIFGGSGGTDGGACVANPPEICNGVDDDCDGVIDNGIDWTKPEHCGTCDNNCTQLAHTVEQTCEPPATPDGTTAGTCKFKCETDFYDLDPQVEGCEYQCPWNPNGTNTVDTGGEFGCGRDDDCDGQVDEDMNLCTDVDNCGKCGKKCNLPHASEKCVTTAASGQPCTTTNTGCEIDTCEAGYYDVNKSPDDGCEYQCPVTTPGPEVCDGVDNDCDGLVDNADPSMETSDQNLNAACYGDPDGLCATAAHQGIKKCIDGVITCCDPDSNSVTNTNPKFPATGIRNNKCDATTGIQVLKQNEKPEICNNVDDDCDGQVDDDPNDDGGKCGIGVGSCVQGTEQCQNGQLVCVGKIDPTPEVCNLQDDDCDGVIDGTVPSGTAVSCTTDANCAAGQWCATVGSAKQCVGNTTDAVGACAPPGVQLPIPSGAPCTAGALACKGGVVKCEGYTPTTVPSTDACGVDSNCDGVLTNQPNFQTDVNNCGSCGNKCGTAGDHGVWACQVVSGTPTCVRTGCDNGFINCDGNNNDCEKACTFVSSTEQCNGIDDNCNCQVDENITNKPSPVQVCGVASTASDPNCTAPNVQVNCAGSNGWNCVFPAGYCTGTKPNYCTGTADICDGKDNNCNGGTDEAYTLAGGKTQGYLGQPCASDDGKPPPGDGACKGTGVYVCDTTTTTKCNAVKNTAAAGAELCDGVDNDCDGTVDEPFKATTLYPAGKGTNTTFFVKPAVTKIGANLWISQYEMSRPGATNVNPGSGNGYQTSAPAGATIDKTQACSAAGVVPWFNITPVEAAQTCTQRGGRLCSTTDWQTACQATVSCKWGYNPRGAACTSPAAGPKYCNLGAFDFDGNPGNGNQDGLLPTASSLLPNCWADWAGLQGNLAAFDDIRDVTGNLREITYNSSASTGCTNGTTSPSGGCLYTLMGGAFNTDAEDGAACNFTFFTVDAQYKLFDVGYRCCFDQDPTL